MIVEKTELIGIMAVSEQRKDVFREILLDLVGINFGNCRILMDH